MSKTSRLGSSLEICAAFGSTTLRLCRHHAIRISKPWIEFHLVDRGLNLEVWVRQKLPWVFYSESADSDMLDFSAGYKLLKRIPGAMGDVVVGSWRVNGEDLNSADLDGLWQQFLDSLPDQLVAVVVVRNLDGAEDLASLMGFEFRPATWQFHPQPVPRYHR
ncbi:hypothetical protein KL935_005020 [Ogataea polymorpha]|nr:hypothetical protein KL935_005020 [Ogataea polymorpha]KAG7913679.1 hypothetical protein KL927_005265 [Ogataea polymorpha]